MLENLRDTFLTIDHFHKYLDVIGMRFNEDGFPLVSSSCFLTEAPELVVPYSHRNSRLVRDPERTILCFHMSDVLNYRRVERVFSDLPEYRRFLAVAATDITVTADMEPEWQAAIMLTNALFLAVLAVNGIKVVANLRCGGRRSVRYLSWIPKGVACITSTLGCDDLADPSDCSFLAKVMLVRPDPLILYGKRDEIMIDQLLSLGFDVWHQLDSHALSKGRG